MGNLTMSRRTFSKLMAATTAAVAVGASFSGQKGLAQETAAQSAAAEEGVRKIRSCCRGCGKVECGVWVYVKDGRVIRTEGDDTCFNLNSRTVSPIPAHGVIRGAPGDGRPSPFPAS